MDAARVADDRDRNAEGRPENARPRDRFGAPQPRGAVDEMTGRVDPDDVVTDVADALERGAALFDAQRFFEAHEFFEWIWKRGGVPESDRTFWKGVAQVAVGYVHTQRGNASGAQTLLHRGARHLRLGARDGPADSGRDVHAGVDAARLAADALAFADLVAHDGASPEAPFPRFPRRGERGDAPLGSPAMAVDVGLAPGHRYRCSACGNVTRFDVESVERVRRFWHVELGGRGRVESEERDDVDVRAVRCRWCGSAEAIEQVPAIDPPVAASPSDAT